MKTERKVYLVSHHSLAVEITFPEYRTLRSNVGAAPKPILCVS